MLHKFSRQLAVGGSVEAPPYVIRASNLDKNFSLCYPISIEGNNAPYSVIRAGEEGYTFKGNRVFDVCENGKPVKYLFFAERLPDA
jgi:hypothetical protein